MGAALSASKTIAQYELAATSTLSDPAIVSASWERRRVAGGVAGAGVDMVTLGSVTGEGCAAGGVIRCAIGASSRMGCIVAIGRRGVGCGAVAMAAVAVGTSSFACSRVGRGRVVVSRGFASGTTLSPGR
jgi:hypothetical protein